VEQCAPNHTLQAAASPEERPVDAAAVHDEPTTALALKRAVGCTSDQELGVRLESDVVRLGKATDAHMAAGQPDARELRAVGGEDHDLRSKAVP
jgi:hypothetical protein